MSRATKSERETSHNISIARWERERRQRVEALCAAITDQRAALAKLGGAHIEARAVGSLAAGHMTAALNAMHDALEANVVENNPFLKGEGS